jgi:hypothetical protein
MEKLFFFIILTTNNFKTKYFKRAPKHEALFF